MVTFRHAPNGIWKIMREALGIVEFIFFDQIPFRFRLMKGSPCLTHNTYMRVAQATRVSKNNSLFGMLHICIFRIYEVSASRVYLARSASTESLATNTCLCRDTSSSSSCTSQVITKFTFINNEMRSLFDAAGSCQWECESMCVEVGSQRLRQCSSLLVSIASSFQRLAQMYTT